MILLKWIYVTRHLAVAISDRLFKQGGGGGQGGSKEWGAGLGASGSKAACTEDEGMI